MPMKILLANPRGFCAGVNMAIDCVDRVLKLKGPPIYVYHEIVHNKHVVDRFIKQGVVFVNSIEEVPAGGTVVYSALELADTIRAERFASGWNVYAAQASDGDAFGADPARSARFLREKLLPATRYYTYLELAAPDSQDHSSTLWAEYERVAEASANFAMRHATKREEIYPVFRELFKKESQ